VQWKLFLTRHYFGILSIGCGHCGNLFCFPVQEIDGASDHNMRDQEMDGESDLGIWPGGVRERKRDTPLEQDDIRQVG
jgi:hypothetical protein